MTELSRASGRKAAFLLQLTRAQRAANPAIPEIRNQAVRRMVKRFVAWVGASALAVLACMGAHAQQQTPTAPIGDIYESGGGSLPTYSDTFESNCQNTSIYKGMNPLVCYGITGSPDLSGKCANTGPTVSLWKQEGRVCIYCQHLNPPLTDGFVVPFDELKATESQGFTCGVNQTDPSCSVVCYGPGGAEKFKPPPGLERVPTPGEPETPSPGETPETPPPTQLFGATPPQPCNEQEPADDPAAESQLRYGLGFVSGFKACAVSQITLQNIAVAALAARYKSIALLLAVAAAPQVIDGVLHPPGTSENANPYLKGVDEGGRLCTWLLKVSPALIRRCPAAAGPAATSATCTVSTLAADLNAATAAMAAQGTRRLDCFQCTMAWLKGETYTPAANQVATNVKDIESQFAQDYGKLVPQGPPLPCWRQAAQEKGIPGSMSPTGIDNEMKNAGSGAKGVIILLQNINDNIGHVVGVETMGSGKNEHVIYWDAQSGETAKGLVQSAQWIRFYRIQ